MDRTCLNIMVNSSSVAYLMTSLLMVFLFLVSISCCQLSFAQPIISDPDLRVILVAEGLSSPTGMSFVNVGSSNDDVNGNEEDIDGSDIGILILEKNSGKVRLISGGKLYPQPVLELNVDNTTLTCCRGLLGITTKSIDAKTEVFLYFSEALGKHGDSSGDANGEDIQDRDSGVRNRVYKYDWDNENHVLLNPRLLLDLPAEPGPNHPAGKIVIGSDGYLYTAIGDLNNEGQLQNIQEGPPPSDSSVFIRINATDGSPAPGNPFENLSESYPESQVGKYYGYGLRNSFGMAIDPVTGILWDTENGDRDYDEINIVKPGFNSGWKRLMGPLSENDISINDLVLFPGSHYADPLLSWSPSLGITDIEFFASSTLGPKYQNNVFIGDITNGNLYYLELNSTRTGLSLSPNLQSDLTIDSEDDKGDILFGTGFGGITDIQTGPDGYLYILTLDEEKDGEGAIYRIEPATST
jgi:glucose/arabinose dehydrogenase